MPAWWIGIFGLLLRIVYAWYLGEALFLGDALAYIEGAEKILETGWADKYWPPGLPYILACFYAVFGQGFWTTVSAMLCFYIFFWILVCLHLQPVQYSLYKILVLFIFAIYPAFIHHSVAPLTHLPLAVCVLAISYSLVHISFTPVPAFFVGLIHVIAIFLRPASVLLIPVSIIFLLYKRKPIQASAWSVFLLSVIFPLVIWHYASYERYGYFFYVNEANAYNVFLGNNPYTPLYKTWWLGSHRDQWETTVPEFSSLADSISRLSSEEQGKAYRKVSITHISSRPDIFLIRSWNRLKVFWAYDTFTGARIYDDHPSYALCILALDALCYGSLILLFIFVLTHSSFFLLLHSHLLVAGMVLGLSLPYYFSFSHPTYHLAVVPLLGILVGNEFSHTSLSFRSLTKSEMILRIFLLLFFFYIQIEWTLAMLHPQPNI